MSRVSWKTWLVTPRPHYSYAGQRLPFSFSFLLPADCSSSTSTHPANPFHQSIPPSRLATQSILALRSTLSFQATKSSRCNGRRPRIVRTLGPFAVITRTFDNSRPSLTARSSTASIQVLPRIMSDKAMAVLGHRYGIRGVLASIRYFRPTMVVAPSSLIRFLRSPHRRHKSISQTPAPKTETLPRHLSG